MKILTPQQYVENHLNAIEMRIFSYDYNHF